MAHLRRMLALTIDSGCSEVDGRGCSPARRNRPRKVGPS